LILGAFFVAGCGDTVIDASKAEGAIQANLEKSLDEKVASVVCPTGQKVEVGKEFKCTIDFSNGKHATVTLKIRNQEADTDVVGFEQTE
jgi:dihydrodipicolinate reductase